MQGAHGPGSEARKVSGGEFEFAPPGLLPGDLMPRRAGTSLGSFEWESLALWPTGLGLCCLLEQDGALKMKGRLPLGCARFQVPHNHGF